MPTKRTPHRAPPGFVSKIPTTASTDHRPTNDSAEEPLTMRHDRIRAGSKRSEAENDNPNVTPIRDSQPDDPGEGHNNRPGEGTGVGPKRDAPDTDGAGITDEVERNARREKRNESIVLGGLVAAAGVTGIALAWLALWLSGY